MKHVVIFEMGGSYMCADTTRVFSSIKKAMEQIPKGFKEFTVKGCNYYAENERRNKWLKIQRYGVE